MLKLLLPLGIALALSPTLAGQWAHHRCAAGDKDYDPGHGLAQQRPTAGYDLALTVGPEDWYDPTPLGRDALDWLKAAGVSYFNWFSPGSWAKNRRSALVGFRMLTGRRYEVCAYVNDPEGGFRYDGVQTLAVGDTVRVRYRLDGDTAAYELTGPAGSTKVSFPDFTAGSRQVNVGPWHGGSLPAPQDTGLWTDFRLADD